jgi:hypothetical protein
MRRAVHNLSALWSACVDEEEASSKLLFHNLKSYYEKVN